MRRSTRFFPALLLTLIALHGETVPRDKPDKYSAQASVAGVTLAADSYGRAAPGERTSYFTGHYMVIEVAIYPDKGTHVDVRPSDFRLVINGGKSTIAPGMAGQAAYDARMSDLESNGVNTQFGPFSIPGSPRPGPQYPGDPSAQPPPNRPRAPDSTSQAGTRAPAATPEEALTAMALEQRVTSDAVSGYLYFLWEPSAKKIKSMALTWTPNGESTPRVTLQLIRAH